LSISSCSGQEGGYEAVKQGRVGTNTSRSGGKETKTKQEKQEGLSEDRAQRGFVFKVASSSKGLRLQRGGFFKGFRWLMYTRK
jgi:hypothetical protein